MRSEFKFPVVAGLWMTLTLALVLLAIEKGSQISSSTSAQRVHPGSTDWAQVALLPETIETFLAACLAGAAAWGALFVLRRSGVQRLSELHPGAAGKSPS
jgi:hypothetical protein